MIAGLPKDISRVKYGQELPDVTRPAFCLAQEMDFTNGRVAWSSCCSVAMSRLGMAPAAGCQAHQLLLLRHVGDRALCADLRVLLCDTDIDCDATPPSKNPPPGFFLIFCITYPNIKLYFPTVTVDSCIPTDTVHPLLAEDTTERQAAQAGCTNALTSQHDPGKQGST